MSTNHQPFTKMASPLEQPSGLIDQQHVQLYVMALDDTLSPSPSLPSVDEDDDFVDKMMGIWRVEDDELRRWVAEENLLC